MWLRDAPVTCTMICPRSLQRKKFSGDAFWSPWELFHSPKLKHFFWCAVSLQLCTLYLKPASILCCFVEVMSFHSVHICFYARILKESRFRQGLHKTFHHCRSIFLGVSLAGLGDMPEGFFKEARKALWPPNPADDSFPQMWQLKCLL